jgi:hypothetical protein
VPVRNPSIRRQLGIVSLRTVPLSPMADELRKLIVQVFAEAKNAIPSKQRLSTRMKNIH